MPDSLRLEWAEGFIMSEITESKEYKDLMSRFDTLTKSSEENEKYIGTLKKSVDDIKTDRADLKEKLKLSEGKKSNDDESLESLKDLLRQKDAEIEKSNLKINTDRLMTKVRDKAREKGFVKNKGGQLNSKLLESSIDISKLTEGDDGEIFGLDQVFDKLRESDPYMFEKKGAVPPDLDAKPGSKVGSKIDSEAFKKAGSVAEKVAMMKARGEEHKKATNGMMPGMGNAIGLVNKTESSEGAAK